MFVSQILRFVTPTLIILLGTALQVRAVEERRYRVDFSSPPHTVGMPPSQGTTSAPSNGVSTIVFGKPTVVGAFGALTQQPLELRGGGSFTDYSQIQFGLGHVNDFLTFESDFYVRSDVSSDGLRFIFDTPEVRTVDFAPNGQISVFVPGVASGAVGKYELNRKNTFRAHINLRTATWRLFLNGILLNESNFNASKVEGIRINLARAAAQSPAAALDNIVINSYSGSPTIIEHPENQTVAETGTATLRVISSGQTTDPSYRPRYQWLFNGQSIAGATSDRLIIQAATKADAGSYSVIVSNDFFSSTSTTATLTVTPGAARLLNIATRLNVQQGERALIGGFIIRGVSSKRVIIRAVGPSLGSDGMPLEGRLDDPTLQLFNSKGELIAENDDWRDTQEQQIRGTTIPPDHDREAAIVAQLEPGNYTAIVRGVNNGTGVGLVEVYDIDGRSATKLANVSTRGQVETGNNVMIGGLIVGGGETGAVVLLRAIGPSLQSSFAILPDALLDPSLQLRNAEGEVVAENDNWKSTQRAQIEATGAQPTDDREAAIIATLLPGNYTATVAGVNQSTGLAVVEAYHLQQ